MAELYYPYIFSGPKMDKSVSPPQVNVGSCYHVSGVDGRYTGGMRKFYGMKRLLDMASEVSGLSTIGDHAGITYMKGVTFLKMGTSDVYRGFIIRWDSQDNTSNQQIDLVYTLDNGSTWARKAIWAAGNGITSSTAIDCDVEGEFLFVVVDGLASKTIYYDSGDLTIVDMGPGAFSATLGPPSEESTSVDEDYQLKGNGVYQIAWRFYSSTRGIYSALSEPITVHMDHYKPTAATNAVYFNSTGGDNGLFIEEDTITIAGRSYEADSDDSYTADVKIDISGVTSIAGCAAALAHAINGDSDSLVSATAAESSVTLTAREIGAEGNSYELVVSEAGSNLDDILTAYDTFALGGSSTTVPEEQCKVVIKLPTHGNVVSGQTYTEFAAMFDTIDIFRSIDLGKGAASYTGAILYLEQSLSKGTYWSSSSAWDNLEINVGTIIDEALPFLTMYDPEKDIVLTPPSTGAIARYQGLTFMGEAVSVRGGYDIVHSSAEHVSAEYFTTYNRRFGDAREGRILRFIGAADSLFGLAPNAIIHIYKSSQQKSLQFSRLHLGKGLMGRETAHSIGNAILMMSGTGLCIFSATDGTLGQLSAVNRLLFDEWEGDMCNLKSGYDALLNASFFLNACKHQIVAVWLSPQNITMLEGANFTAMTENTDIEEGEQQRVYFATRTGVVVYPDAYRESSGTMWGYEGDYTFNGSASATGNTLTDDTATFHASMVGALCYMTSGQNAGLYQTIESVDTGNGVLTFEEEFANQIVEGDTYAISPVPFKVRLWPLQVPEVSKFNRWKLSSLSVKATNLDGFTNNPNNQWRVGGYRNGRMLLEQTTSVIDVAENPSDAVAPLVIDGIDVEPYIEQIAAGVDFELVNVEAGLSGTGSRKVMANE